MAFQEGDITAVLPNLGHVILLKALQEYVVGNHVIAAAVNAGGTGYVVGDVLTVAGGTKTRAIFDATIEVTSVSSGVITAARVVNAGSFSVNPTTTANAVTGGTGTGATFNLTMESATWTVDRNTYTNDQTEFQLIMHGQNASGNPPYIGIGSFTNAGVRQWQLRYMSSFDNSLTFGQQPGVSPGFEFGTTPSGGPRIPLTDGNLHFFFFVSGRRIIVVSRITPSFEMAYLGLFTPFVDSPATVFPLPIMVAGTTVADTNSGVAYNNGTHASVLGHGQMNAYYLRWLDGTHREFDVSSKAAVLWPSNIILTNIEADAPAIPGGGGTGTPNGGAIGNDWISSSASGSQTDQFSPAPFGVGSRTFPLFPYTIYEDRAGATQIIGELEGIFKIPGRGIAGEQRVIGPDGNVYVVFPDCNSSAFTDFYCIREA